MRSVVPVIDPCPWTCKKGDRCTAISSAVENRPRGMARSGRRDYVRWFSRAQRRGLGGDTIGA